MRMALRGMSGLVCAGAMLAATAAHALPAVQVNLGPPIINGNQAQLPITINFDDDGDSSAGLTFFQIDVSQSDPALTSNGNDYSRFSFTPSLPMGWDQLGTGFGPDPFSSVDAYILTDSFTDAASALYEAGNPHVVGTLNINLAGLVAGSALAVDIGFFDIDGTSFAYEAPVGDFQTFEFVDVDDVTGQTRQIVTVPQTTTPAVPEPATMMLGVLSAAGLLIRRRVA